MLKKCLWKFCLVFCLPVLAFSGCGSGGNSSPSVIVGPVGAVAPLSHDFGDVTLSNSPAAKEFTLTNSGNAPLEVSDVSLTGTGFSLDLVGDSDNFCGSSAFPVPEGDSCVVAVDFEPILAGPYSGTLTVSSNDPVSSPISISVNGNGVAVSEPIVRINQVEPDACPSSTLTVYVSATDQAGYSLSGLPLSSFSLSETDHGGADPITEFNSLAFVGEVQAPISVALVMDYSSSISLDPPVVAAMEDGVISFINQLTADDEVQIVKFANTTSDPDPPFIAGTPEGKEELIATVRADVDLGTMTAVYDAVYQAVEDAALRATERRAVIVLSDGFDNDGEGNQLSDSLLVDVIALADSTGVPVFSIGIGAELKENILRQLSDNTGGQYYPALNGDNLRTIYQQQAEVLFFDQYVLTYDSVFNTGESALLTVGLKLDEETETVYNSRTIIPCP